MEKLGAFLGEHPETAAAVQLILPALSPPTSFATTRYNALHAFAFTNADGETRYGRYSFIPEAGEELLPEEEIDSADRDYLEAELRERLAAAADRLHASGRRSPARATCSRTRPSPGPRSAR